jgi:hypothetical protein
VERGVVCVQKQMITLFVTQKISLSVLTGVR